MAIRQHQEEQHLRPWVERGIQSAPGMARLVVYSWQRHDPLARASHHPALRIEQSNAATIAALAQIDPAESHERIKAGNRAYIGIIGGEPVAYGWSANRHALIGELGLTVRLAPGERYLWDFVTLPEWRGQGIYPRLLRAIVAHEAAEVERSWIAHLPGNNASARGIAKAGFRRAGVVTTHSDGQMAFTCPGRPQHSLLAARLLGLPVVYDRS